MTTPHDPTADADRAEYSATVLGSQWIQRPEPDATLVDTGPDATLVDTGPDATLVDTEPDATLVDSTGSTTVLRFGPGVTHRLTVALPPARPPRRPRRHTLPVLVLIAAALFVLWRQHATAPVAVRAVTVTAEQGATGCDRTVDLVGTVKTNGRDGTLTYRWIRNDGTSSAVQHTTLARGQRSVRLHLLWSFQGQGHYAAAAQLRVLSPGARSDEVRFDYTCP